MIVSIGSAIGEVMFKFIFWAFVGVCTLGIVGLWMLEYLLRMIGRY